jgi:hypothetical protein
VGADAGAAELRVDRAAIGLAGGGPTPGQDPARVPFAVASAQRTGRRHGVGTYQTCLLHWSLSGNGQTE